MSLHHTSHPRMHARPPLLEMADKIGRKYVTTNGNDTYNHYRYFVRHHQSYSCNPSQVFLKFDRIQTFLCGGVLYTGKYRNSYYMLELLTSFSIKLLCSLSDISEYLQYILAISVSGTYLVRNTSISLSTYLPCILMW